MINWELFLTQLGGTTAIVAAIAWLARSILLHGFSHDLETHKANLRRNVDTAIEHLRLHDHDRTEAQKRLYRFAKTIENETFPLAENKCEGFRRKMKELYWSTLQLDQIYYSDRVDEILEHFAEMDICMRCAELAEETKSEIHTFLECEAFSQAEELARLARAATESIREAIQQGHPVDARTSRD